MKINGKINVMGIREVTFKCGDGNESKYIFDTTSTWCRVPLPFSDRSKHHGFYRTHEEMTRSIKALAQNPHAELSFNDGLLVITLE